VFGGIGAEDLRSEGRGDPKIIHHLWKGRIQFRGPNATRWRTVFFVQIPSLLKRGERTRGAAQKIDGLNPK